MTTALKFAYLNCCGYKIATAASLAPNLLHPEIQNRTRIGSPVEHCQPCPKINFKLLRP